MSTSDHQSHKFIVTNVLVSVNVRISKHLTYLLVSPLLPNAFQKQF